MNQIVPRFHGRTVIAWLMAVAIPGLAGRSSPAAQPGVGSPRAEPAVPRTDTRTTQGDGVRVAVTNDGDRRSEILPVTFGHPFRRGAFPSGVRVAAADSGAGLPASEVAAQVDVKRRHEDGSVRFAVVSALLPGLAPGETTVLELTPTEGAATVPGEGGGDAGPALASPADILRSGFDAAVTFRFPDGTTRSASARRLLERDGERAPTWLRGPVVTEWLVAGAPEDERGMPDDDLQVRFEVRAYRGLQAVRVSVAVESCWDTWAGNIRYDAAVSVGGREAFRRQAVDHRPLSRWRRVFWWDGEPPRASIAHDVESLAATGAIPRYDRTLPVAPRGRGDERRSPGAPEWDILGRGPLTAYMPTTGGRPEIAPYPLWTVRYLLTMDPEARDHVLAAGDLAGSWPIHVRSRETGRVLTIDRRPRFWLDERGEDRPRWKAPRHAPAPGATELSPDLAHQPSLAHVPFLVSGDFYYLEEAWFWAGYCLLATWPHPRGNERGILAGQIRGDAWALRNIADAAWVAPGGEPEAAYFAEKVRNNLADRVAAMYGPGDNAIGAWGLRTVEDARIQEPANPRWAITVPWEHDYLLWSLHHLVELGWSEAARARDFLLRLRVGTLTHAPDFDPRLATPYRMVVGEFGPDREPVVWEDWKVLGRENARLSKPDVPNYGCSYAYSARAALICGIDGGFPGAREALATLEDMLPDHRRILAEEPFWAIAPGGAAARRDGR